MAGEDAGGGLVAAARRGDVAAFNALVQQHQRQVYNLCYRTLGNAEDAADATQEAFFRAYRGIGSFRGEPDGFRGWLLRIAVNACYDDLRRHKRRPTASLDEPLPGTELPSGEGLPDPQAGPEQRALAAETSRSIEAALARLSVEQRLAVVLCDVQGLSYEEAARAMGVELGTVRSRLSRGRAALRESLAATGELPATVRRQE